MRELVMTIDFAILGENERIEKEVRLSENLHDELMSHASRLGSTSLLSRVSDYYEGGEIAVTELDLLLGELRKIQGSCGDDNLLPVVDELVALVGQAISERKVVAALSD